MLVPVFWPVPDAVSPVLVLPGGEAAHAWPLQYPVPTLITVLQPQYCSQNTNILEKKEMKIHYKIIFFWQI